METSTDSRVYRIRYEGRVHYVRAKSNKQATNFLARQADRMVRDLAVTSIASFEDGIEAERLGITVQDATTSEDDNNQLDLGV